METQVEALTILIVEDEEKLAKSLQRQLTRAGYRVRATGNGLSAEKALREEAFSLIVLDLSLPGKGGMDLLRDLRSGPNATPVLIISATGEVQERVKGLTIGADDFLVKPFDPAEFLARVQALLRRVDHTASGLLRAGDLVMDPVRNKVTRAGKAIHLSPREFSLLQYLLRNKNRVVTRQQITEQVWGYSFDTGTNVVDVYISYLRKAVDEGFGRNLILTIHGKGFLLVDTGAPLIS